MTSTTHVAVWFLLSSLVSSICHCYVPPLSSIHEINTRKKQDDQMIAREKETIIRRKRGVDHYGRQTVEVFSPLTMYYHKWKKRDGDDLDLQRVHSSLSPHPHQSTFPTRGRKVGTKWNVDNSRPNSNITTPSISITTTTTITITTTATTTTATTPTPTTTSTTTAAAAATSMIYPFISSSLNHPLSPVLPSSSCSSKACKWLASWQFIVVVCMTLAWLVGLMILYCMTRTTKGKVLLETFSSLCTHDEQDQDEVTTKGIGYLDGSPGLRRFVLIEDEKEEEDEENDVDDFTSAFKDVESKENEVERGDGNPKRMKPPRRGTYILQEASKKGVLEVGTYRIQEKEDEEEEEVHGKRKDQDKEEEEVEYILEGATYILQSERVEREKREINGGEERGGYIGGIEGLYGIIGRQGQQGGYRGLGGFRVYGIMGRGEECIRGGRGRYSRIKGIEELYEILHDEVSEEVGDRGEDDGILLSVRELVGTVTGGKNEEKIRGGSMSEGGRTEAKGEEWREVRGRGDAGGGWIEGRGGAREKGGKEANGSKRKKGEKIVVEKEKEERGRVKVRDTWGGTKGKGVKATSGGGGEGSRRVNTPPSPKRAASFPMDHFLSSHLVPRKLSLIVEEDIH